MRSSDTRTYSCTGLRGTGKSHLMKEVDALLQGQATAAANPPVAIETDEERDPLSVTTHSRVITRWVTFHQGYSYEDFILGMRPIASASGFSLAPKPGVLLELVAEARDGALGLLLIDEINRGNTSRIFGEFITLMEPDKRLDSNGAATPTTVTITLPYLSPDESVTVGISGGLTKDIRREFQMPSGVLTLASMNSVDKSISPMDTALRRRFHVINLAPSREDIRSAVGLGPANDVQNPIAEVAAAVVAKLNQSIGYYLGADFMLGQWYLPSLIGDQAQAEQALSECWLYRISPQLLELFHGKEDQLISVLGGSSLLAQPGGGIEVREPSESEREQGAMAYVEVRFPPPSSGEVIAYLQALAGPPTHAAPSALATIPAAGSATTS